MDLHYLKLFHAVAKNLSFSKTAEQLHISQPAISMQIKKMEDDLGIPVFDRIGRGIFLNAHGKLLYEYTSKIFNLVDEVENRFQEMEDKIWGNLVIGCSTSPAIFIMPEIISQFRTRYPLVNITLHIGTTYEIHTMLRLNQLDFALVGGSSSESLYIQYNKVWDDRVIFFASPDNPLCSYSNVTMEELSKESIIAHDYKSKLYELMEHAYKDLNLPFQPSMVVGSVEAMVYLVGKNHGISFLPYMAVAKDLANGTLKEVPIKDKVWTYDFYVGYLKNRELSPALEKLIMMSTDYFITNKESLSYDNTTR